MDSPNPIHHDGSNHHTERTLLCLAYRSRLCMGARVRHAHDHEDFALRF